VAWAKASPTSRKVTSRNGGGRSSAGFDDVRKRLRGSGGIAAPGLAKAVCNDYNLLYAVTRPALSVVIRERG
jgi:hypothetical protein